MTGMIFKRWILAFYKEIAAGRGPIYLNLTRNPEAAAGFGDGFTRKAFSNGYVRTLQREGVDITKEKVEWRPVPEFHAGPVRVDLNCETTVSGLYATGDATQNGSAFQGSVEGCGLTGGVPLGWAMVSGFRAGTAAGKAAAKGSAPEVKEAELEKLRKEIFAPLGGKGGYDPYEAIKEIQTTLFRLKNSFIKSKDRLEDALGTVKKIKAELPKLTAKDSHELVRCHEAKSMIPSAEMLYKASLMRTETRGTNVREDYPEQDDQNWLKWIIIKKEGEDMKLWTEPVPIGQYKHKPS
jgi:succinate dehydrogenase/fumarate reductase flavoprotein subunit